MVRMAVGYYLILAFSAGPAAFCCCALNSLAAPFHAVAVITPGPPPQPDGHCPLCKTHQDRPTSPEKPPAPDKEPPGGCPCKGHCPAAVLSDAVSDDAREWSSEPVVAGVSAPELPAIFTPDLAALNRPDVPTGLRDGPWLSAGDLLSTHHVIRC